MNVHPLIKHTVPLLYVAVFVFEIYTEHVLLLLYFILLEHFRVYLGLCQGTPIFAPVTNPHQPLPCSHEPQVLKALDSW